MFRIYCGAAAASGVAFRASPIPDRGVPTSNEAVGELAREIIVALENGQSVAVHCRQGIAPRRYRHRQGRSRARRLTRMLFEGSTPTGKAT